VGKSSGCLWDNPACKDVAMGFKNFLCQGGRGDHHCGFHSEGERHERAVFGSKVEERFMGFLTQLKQISHYWPSRRPRRKPAVGLPLPHVQDKVYDGGGDSQQRIE